MKITKENRVIFQYLKKYWRRIEQSEVVDLLDIQTITYLRKRLNNGN